MNPIVRGRHQSSCINEIVRLLEVCTHLCISKGHPGQVKLRMISEINIHLDDKSWTRLTNQLIKVFLILHPVHKELRDVKVLILQVHNTLLVESPGYRIHFRTTDFTWVLK